MARLWAHLPHFPIPPAVGAHSRCAWWGQSLQTQVQPRPAGGMVNGYTGAYKVKLNN